MRLVLATLAILLAAAPSASAELTEAEPIDVAGHRIARSDLQHWQRVAATRDGSKRFGARVHRRQAAQLLISARWLELEAPRHGVRVTRREVRRSFRLQRSRSFDSLREYRRFLRRSGQTDRDIRFQVRSDLLSGRIRDAVLEGVPEDDQPDALARFVDEFDARWRAVTTCSPRYHHPLRCQPR